MIVSFLYNIFKLNAFIYKAVLMVIFYLLLYITKKFLNSSNIFNHNFN